MNDDIAPQPAHSGKCPVVLKEAVVCKHTMSSLPDVEHRYEIDHGKKMVRIFVACLDLVLLGDAAAHIQETQGASLVREDSRGGFTLSAPLPGYSCSVECEGIGFDATFVRLALSGTIDVVLRPAVRAR